MGVSGTCPAALLRRGVTARILQFGSAANDPGEKTHRFEASVADDGCIRIVIGHSEGEQVWLLTPRQAVELAAFLNNEWAAPGA
jgi:hypothetical protein